MAETHTEIIVAGLLLAVAALVTLARVMNVPYPIFLVLGGLAIGFVPGMPEVQLDPDLVLLIFLPPLLYSAAFFAFAARPAAEPRDDLRCSRSGSCWRRAWRGRRLPARGDPGLLVGGGVRAGRDRLAHRPGGRDGDRRPARRAASRRRGGRGRVADQRRDRDHRLPRRGLVALTAGTFSLWEAGERVPAQRGAGGVAIGLAVGWVIANIRARINDPPVEITISLVHRLRRVPARRGAKHLSGVTAAVAIGLYMGSQTSRLTNSTVRMQGDAVWQILVFLLNSFLFVLIGLQLPTILDDLRGEDLGTGELILYGGAATVTVIVIRLVWTFVLRLPPALAVPQPARAQPGPEAAQRRDHRVDGDARRRLARRRARAPARHRRRRPLRRAPADPVHRLLRDPRDARAAGALAARR